MQHCNCLSCWRSATAATCRASCNLDARGKCNDTRTGVYMSWLQLPAPTSLAVVCACLCSPASWRRQPLHQQYVGGVFPLSRPL